MAAASTYHQLTHKYTWRKPEVIHTANPWHEGWRTTVLIMTGDSLASPGNFPETSVVNCPSEEPTSSIQRAEGAKYKYCILLLGNYQMFFYLSTDFKELFSLYSSCHRNRAL